ncbi:MAG: Crp/Fnr family transcriptional regulator [Bacteroidota bacterium]
MNTTIERVIFLQSIELFADIPSEQLAQIAGITEYFTLSEDEILFKKGDKSQHLFLLIDGSVAIYRNEKENKHFVGPEALGVWGFFDDGDRLMTISCTTECQFLRIDQLDFFDLLEDRVHLSRGLLKYFVKRIRKLIEVSDEVI